MKNIFILAAGGTPPPPDKKQKQKKQQQAKHENIFPFTSEMQHRLVLPRLRHHFPASLQDKVAVDELPDAGDSEGDLRMHNAEVLIQMDIHSLQLGDDLLEVHSSLVHHQLYQTPPPGLPQLISYKKRTIYNISGEFLQRLFITS